jgi:tRNA-dependent cyclodipeptide synthase
MDDRHPLKATFRHNPGQYKKIYPHSSCVLLISVGQQYHEGESLKAIVDAINSSQFKFCNVVMGDFIQRYTLQILKNISANQAEAQAILDGDAWLDRNRPTINTLSMPFRIFRWQEWLMNPRFEQYYAAVKSEILTSTSFQHEFEKSIEEFLVRAQKLYPNQEIFSTENRRLCLEYLQEECSIIMPLWAFHYDFDFVIYPAHKLDAMEATYQKFVAPYTSKLYWLPLRFKRRCIEKNVHV